MHCPQCHYVLFGLSEPRCPECGRDYEVTDFYFKPGSVHFLCPHCRQGYAGNDENGLPRPRSFRCCKCQKYVNAAGMVVRPMRADASGDLLRYGSVWDFREKIGLFSAYWETLRQIARRPAEFFRMAYATDRPSAFLFACLNGCLAVLVLMIGFSLWGGFRDQSLDAFNAAFSPPRMLATFTAVIVLTFAWVYLYTIFIHIMFACLGICRAHVESTIQVVAYSSAVLPAVIAPPVAMVWYLGIIVTGLREIHDIPAGRAWVAGVMAMLMWLAIVGGVVTYLLL